MAQNNKFSRDLKELTRTSSDLYPRLMGDEASNSAQKVAGNIGSVNDSIGLFRELAQATESQASELASLSEDLESKIAQFKTN